MEALICAGLVSSVRTVLLIQSKPVALLNGFELGKVLTVKTKHSSHAFPYFPILSHSAITFTKARAGSFFFFMGKAVQLAQ